MNTYDAIIAGACCGGAPLAMLQPLPEEIQGMLPMVAKDPMAIAAFVGAFMGSVPLDQVFSPALMNRSAEDVQHGHEENRHVA